LERSQQMLGRFNAYVKSVILRVSEGRDLGEIDRFKFYDHTKIYTAAPPDVLRVDEKHLREHYVFNVLGFVLTTNHKTDGLYLPADDRRHYVAWSNCAKDEFTPKYWNEIWSWYDEGGFEHVAAYLNALDRPRTSLSFPIGNDANGLYCSATNISAIGAGSIPCLSRSHCNTGRSGRGACHAGPNCRLIRHASLPSLWVASTDTRRPVTGPGFQTATTQSETFSNNGSPHTF
jgi:hypothetical protein